jgi:hypothetical protein
MPPNRDVEQISCELLPGWGGGYNRDTTMTYCLLLTVLSVAPADNSAPFESGVSGATVQVQNQIYQTAKEANAAARKARLPLMVYRGPRPVHIYQGCVILWISNPEDSDSTGVKVTVVNIVSDYAKGVYLSKDNPSDREIEEAIKRLRSDLRRY